MKRSPIARGTSQLARGKPMKPGRKKKATKAESARISEIKKGPCACCEINEHQHAMARADQDGCDAHHTLSGGRRRGHARTLGICPWHHRGIRPGRYASDKEATRALGPSLAHGSKPFTAFYGKDDELIDLYQAAGTPPLK